MPIVVRRSVPGDRAAILALMDAARGEGLAAAERASRGFVQGAMTEEILSRFERGTGVFVAEEGGELAGFAMTSGPTGVHTGPAKRTVDAVAATEQVERDRLFLYGPTAVDPRFQGRGVLTRLLVMLSRELSGRYDLGAAFVEAANEKSLAVHRHYGMSEVARFRYENREYLVFAFDPAAFAARTA